MFLKLQKIPESSKILENFLKFYTVLLYAGSFAEILQNLKDLRNFKTHSVVSETVKKSDKQHKSSRKFLQNLLYASKNSKYFLGNFKNVLQVFEDSRKFLEYSRAFENVL